MVAGEWGCGHWRPLGGEGEAGDRGAAGRVGEKELEGDRERMVSSGGGGRLRSKAPKINHR